MFQCLVCIIRGIMEDLQAISEVMDELALQGFLPLRLLSVDYRTVYSMLDCIYSPRKERMKDIFSKLTGTAEQVRDCVYALAELGDLWWLDYVCRNCEPEKAKGIQREKNARANRAHRVGKRIRTMLEKGDVLFLTLTLDPEAEAEGEKQCVAWVKEFANLFSDYVINTDFGETTGRLHFHGCVPAERVITYDDWPFGFFKVEKVNAGNYSRLKTYIAKLSNHASKEGAKQIIYKRLSRKK